MAQIIIQSGQTLSGIAQKENTTIRELLKLNPEVTDQNLIFAGASLNIPETQISSEPTSGAVNTSEPARQQFDQNTQKVEDLEGQFVSGSTDAVVDKDATEGQIDATTPVSEVPTGAITFKSSNIAFQNLIDQTNQLLGQSESLLTPEIQDQINQINNFEASKIQSIADARDAADKKDTAVLNEALSKVDQIETQEKDIVTQLIEQLRTGRESLIESFAPTERETELRRSLQELRSERELLPLELRQEGISAAGIKARQVGDERVRAIQEGNLLFELGLEQEARQFKSAGLEAQLGFIKDDINLQFKIEDKLRAEEERIVENARDLSKESLDVLNNILDKDAFGGLAFEDLDVQSQADLLKIIELFPDLTPELLSSAMKNAKQREILDKATGVKEIEGKVIGGIEVSNPTLNVIEGIQSLSDLTPSARTQANTELRQLGFFYSTPPDWFKELAEKQLQQSISPEELNRLWEEERQPIISTTTDEGKASISTRTP